MPVKDEERASRLCVECGFCCSGLLYSNATLQPDEVDFARDIGMAVRKDAKGGDCFAQPCHHLCETACSRYQQPRPSVCSSYFCNLVYRMDSGRISEADAQDRVKRVKAMCAQIEPLLEEGESWSDARRRWFESQGKPISNREDAKFSLLMAGLNLMLDQHFREKDGGVISRQASSGAQDVASMKA